MDSDQLNEKQEDNLEKEGSNRHFNSIFPKWGKLPANYKIAAKILPIILIFAAIPLTIKLSLQQQNINSKADTQATASKTVNVSSITNLLTTLTDNTVDEIVVANGTYHISPAGNKASDSLWIGSAYAARTRPVVVKAQTAGGVTFDGGGTTYFGCIFFEDGAHDQTWDGFNCASGQATNTGVIVFGGYAGKPAPHHITMKNIHVLNSCTAHNAQNDHGIYFSEAVEGPHDITLEDITVDGPNAGATGPGLSSAIHFYHSDSTNSNAWNITIKRLHVNGTYQPIILWDSTLKNIIIDTADLTSPSSGTAIRYETTGSTNILIQNVISTGGFYSSLGTNPTGVTLLNNRLNLSSMPNPNPTNTLTTTPKPTNSPTPTFKPTSTPTPTKMPTSTPTPTIKPTNTPTPTPKPTSTPIPTINSSQPTPTITLAPTVSPTPELSPGQQKKCVKFFFFKFCF